MTSVALQEGLRRVASLSRARDEAEAELDRRQRGVDEQLGTFHGIADALIQAQRELFRLINTEGELREPGPPIAQGGRIASSDTLTIGEGTVRPLTAEERAPWSR